MAENVLLSSEVFESDKDLGTPNSIGLVFWEVEQATRGHSHGRKEADRHDFLTEFRRKQLGNLLLQPEAEHVLDTVKVVLIVPKWILVWIIRSFVTGVAAKNQAKFDVREKMKNLIKSLADCWSSVLSLGSKFRSFVQIVALQIPFLDNISCVVNFQFSRNRKLTDDILALRNSIFQKHFAQAPIICCTGLPVLTACWLMASWERVDCSRHHH